MIYLQLFWEFLKIGLFAVGGGIPCPSYSVCLKAPVGFPNPLLQI